MLVPPFNLDALRDAHRTTRWIRRRVGSSGDAESDGPPLIATVMQPTHSPHSGVVVVPYDPRWPLEFECASSEVSVAMGAVVMAVHHIGSTSIPGLLAKPVIDMLAEVSDLSAVDQQATVMAGLGYEVMGEFGITGRRYFRRNDAQGRRTHQIHAFVAGCFHVIRHLAFRDYLRAHPTPTRQYGELKRRLAEAHPHDVEAYMDGKDAFVKHIELQAIAWLGVSKADANTA